MLQSRMVVRLVGMEDIAGDWTECGETMEIRTDVAAVDRTDRWTPEQLAAEDDAEA